MQISWLYTSGTLHGCTPHECTVSLSITCTLHVLCTHAFSAHADLLSNFQVYCIVAKVASKGEAESQVPFWNHVFKIPEREALTVYQSSERLKFYGRQLHVVSIQVYDHETSFHISILSLFQKPHGST